MTFQIRSPLSDPDEHREVASLLVQVFAGEDYTDRANGEGMSTPDELRKRGDVFLAKAGSGELLGMAICVRPHKHRPPGGENGRGRATFCSRFTQSHAAKVWRQPLSQRASNGLRFSGSFHPAHYASGAPAV